MITEQRLGEWVREYLSRILGVTPESIELHRGLSDYGLDSADAVLMAGELEDAFGIEIDPARFLECDSPGSIIAALASDAGKPGRPAATS